MTTIAPDKVISTILKHDSKVTSYKIALLRAVNDVVLNFPDLRTYECDVAIPLRLLADYWIAYYWAFADPQQPIMQGQRAQRQGQTSNDMAFRPALNALRETWEKITGGIKNSADGFFVINELRSPRKRATYPPELVSAYERAKTAIAKSLEMPIKYAGPGHWSVFEKPATYNQLAAPTVSIPGTQVQDKCLVIPFALWQTFR
jgi:hypothetical protein